MIFCLLLTGSRGGFAAFGCMAVGGFVVPDSEKADRAANGDCRARLAAGCGGRRAGPGMAGLFILGRAVWRRGRIIGVGPSRIIKDHPWVGTGPGTFGSIYPKVQDGVDGGSPSRPQQLPANVVGFRHPGISSRLPRCGLVAVRDSHFGWPGSEPGDVAAAAICGALVGWTVHGLVDFELYVPGVALAGVCLARHSSRIEGIAQDRLGAAVDERSELGGGASVLWSCWQWCFGSKAAHLAASIALHGRGPVRTGGRSIRLAALDEATNERGIGALGIHGHQSRLGRRHRALRAGRTLPRSYSRLIATPLMSDPYRASGFGGALARRRWPRTGVDAEAFSFCARPLS
jgi:hypothetical protein